MSLKENDYIVLSEGGFTKSHGKRWLEMLRQWLVKCPQCSEVRLVVGARENNQYVCKDCATVSRSEDQLQEVSKPCLIKVQC